MADENEEFPQGNAFATPEERETALQAALKDEEGGKEKAEGKGDEQKGDEGSNDQDETNPLFTKSDDDDDGDGEDFGLAEPAKDEKVPLKRLHKVISQREAAKGEAKEAEVARAAAEAKLETLENALGQFRDAYKENPQLATFDTRFMETLEKLSETNPNVAQLAEEVKSFMEGRAPETIVTTPNKKTEPAAKEETAPDPRVEAIIRRDATREATEALTEAGLKPAFVKTITKHVVDSAADLTEIDHAATMRAAKTWLKENGFSPADVLVAKPEADEKPDTGGTQKAGSGQQKTSEKEQGGDGRPEKPMSPEEFQAHREKKMRDFFTAEGIDS
jgi:hypothetical protein